MSGTNKVNLDFQAELRAMLGTTGLGVEHFQDAGRSTEDEGKVEHLKAPGTEIEKAKALENSVTTEQLFGENVIEGEIPEMTQDFTMLQSRKDRLVELGTVAQEVYQTKKVSRGQIIAMESIARELVPASEEETQNDQRRVLASDTEVNMYTEEPSVVEAQNTIDNVQGAIDGILGGLKNSTIALGEKIVSTAKADQDKRFKALTEGITNFNASIIQFLENTSQSSLEDARIKFKSNLTWGNLMSMPLDTAMYMRNTNDATTVLGYEKTIEAFDGTSAETLFKNFGDFTASNPIAMAVISNFIAGTVRVISSNSDARDSIEAAGGTKSMTNGGVTFGALFATFGTNRFVDFFNNLCAYIDGEVKAVKIILEQLPGATDVEGVMTVAGGLQRIHGNIMAASANMAVICCVQQMIFDFLANYK